MEQFKGVGEMALEWGYADIMQRALGFLLPPADCEEMATLGHRIISDPADTEVINRLCDKIKTLAIQKEKSDSSLTSEHSQTSGEYPVSQDSKAEVGESN